MSLDWRGALAVAIALSIGAGVAIAIEEIAWLRRRGDLTRSAVREMLLSLSPLPVNVVVSLALAGAWMLAYAIASRFAVARIEPTLWSLLPAVLFADLCYYAEHRAAHRVGLLWKLYHAVHHSSPDYTVATAYRVSFVNQLVAPAFYLPCVFAGFDPALVLVLQVFTIHYQAWVHTRSIGRLPLADGFLNTPANHRMHHDADRSAHGANFGGIFVVWDRLFGSYEPPRDVRAFGIAGRRAPARWYELYTAPFAPADDSRD